MWFQAMAVDTHFWAQSLALWPLSTILGHTPVTLAVHGGFVCHRDACWGCFLGILTSRAVQAAATVLWWSLQRLENIHWVRVFTSQILLYVFKHHTHALSVFSDNCCYSYWRHTETCHFFDRTGQPHFATDKCTISNQVYQVMPGGYKKLTANHNDDRQTSSGDRNIVLESKTMSLSAKVVCLTV